MSRKKKENAAQSTRQLMGIDGIKDYCIATRMGDLVFFISRPCNRRSLCRLMPMSPSR